MTVFMQGYNTDILISLWLLPLYSMLTGRKYKASYNEKMTLNHKYCDKYQLKEAEGKDKGFALQHVFTCRQ